MTRYEEVQELLKTEPCRWLVTGVAGFIGSHLLETLLRLNQNVVGLDDFSTGSRHNLEDVQRRLGCDAFSRFRLVQGDIRSSSACAAAAKDVDFVLHQAALASVPRSMQNPLATLDVNVDGFMKVLVAA